MQIHDKDVAVEGHDIPCLSGEKQLTCDPEQKYGCQKTRGTFDSASEEEGWLSIKRWKAWRSVKDVSAVDGLNAVQAFTMKRS